ncbi:CD83 antigen-like [Anguilla anguilla]|uniref:CD83 antigen-like n=1 Tax=Anguilla anguilla TaxID=7936 RepID=UPI0015B0AA8D|nr:CD83 antigen-like [Anguilla anguilla]
MVTRGGTGERQATSDRSFSRVGDLQRQETSGRCKANEVRHLVGSWTLNFYSQNQPVKMRITLLFLYLFCENTNGDILFTVACGDDTILRCPAEAELQRVQYRAVSWYQVSEGHSTGIIRWDRQTNSVRKFVNLSRDMECPSGDGLTLRIRNLTTKDNGVYRCALWAPVGEFNREWDIQLSVTGCSEAEESYDVKDILLYGAGAFLFLLTLALLLICRLEKQFSTSGKGIKPTLGAYIDIVSLLKKSHGLMMQHV